MREGRELVRLTREYAVDVPWKSWFCLLSTLAVFCALAVVTCLDIGWPLRLLASVVMALVHVRLFVIYHDYQHEAILQDSRLAKFIFNCYGLLSLTPSSVWNHTHDHHHINNARNFGVASIGSYPVMTTEEFRNAPLSERIFYVISRHPLTMVFGYFTVFLWGFSILPLITRPREHLDAVLSVALHATLLIFMLIVRPDIALFTIIIPWFIACAMGAYLFYAQHNFPGVKLRPGKDWDYVYAALHSSSYIRMNPIMAWFTANIGYHHVHHLNARIPFYRLPEAMAAFDELNSPLTTSLTPKEMLRCLRLKLWDSSKDRFVSYREGRRVARTRTPEPSTAG